MIALRGSLSKKITTINMLVSGAALLLASLAYFAYDTLSFRRSLSNSTLIQAQIIGTNAITPLIFNDAKSAESTLAALHAAPHIIYGGVYTAKGDFFAGYWRSGDREAHAFPRGKSLDRESHWFGDGQFSLIEPILFDGKLQGTVYIQSDLGALNDHYRSYLFMLVMILGVSLITALILSGMSQRIVSNPVLDLADLASRISRDKNYSLRAPSRGDRDEVALLVNAFNEMLSEIQSRDTALQQSEQQFRTLADSIPQLAWMANERGEILWYNRRWYKFTGTTPEQVAGWGWQSLMHPDILPDMLSRWRLSLATGEPFEMIVQLRSEDNEYRDFLSLAMPVRGVSGEIVRWFGSNTDITEQRRAQDTLRQTEKLAATGRLAASIAHEINNPLESVMNLIYLMKKQPTNADKYLKLAEQELDRIAQITKNTLGFYRDSASSTEVNISETLKEVLALYTRKLQFKKIRANAELGDNVTVHGYPGELRQIFANLVANAIEAVPTSGVITVRVSQKKDGRGRLGTRITFFDNGPGIPLENRKKIFEPFFTTKKDVGTGLGLWLTMSLVYKHSGSLRVRSSIQEGKSWTGFSLFFPQDDLNN